MIVVEFVGENGQKREGSFRQKKEEWILGKPTASVMLTEWDSREERAQGRMR